MSDNFNQLKALAKPFSDKLVQRKPGGAGGDYVPHSTVTERALSVVGPYSVSVAQLIFEPDGIVSGALVTITCTIDGREVSVTEAGDVENPQSKKTNGARAKDAMSDGVKRCWMRLGLGLHLWSQDSYFLDQLLEKEHPEQKAA